MIHRAMFDAPGADKATEGRALARAPDGTVLARLGGATTATGYGYGFCHALLHCIIVHSACSRATTCAAHHGGQKCTYFAICEMVRSQPRAGERGFFAQGNWTT